MLTKLVNHSKFNQKIDKHLFIFAIFISFLSYSNQSDAQKKSKLSNKKNIPSIIYQCVNYSSQIYKIDPKIILSIIKVESNFNPNAKNTNRNRTFDFGLMQINSTWLPHLKKFNIHQRTLKDPCVNIIVGTWILAQSFQRFGESWRAIGSYNVGNSLSEKKESLRRVYAKKVRDSYFSLRLH
jgi:soluble lytic murein transglycosylase-like protein